MILCLYADQLAKHPTLRAGMFQARADQFKTRLGWDVNVDAQGEERDEYDALNPLYLIWANSDGSHGGSLRLLPTSGRTMINDHFSEVIGGGTIRSDSIWECTRFCLARNAEPKVAAALMMTAGQVMQDCGIAHCAAVFDERMIRIYNRIGAGPDVMGSQGQGRSKISIGLWSLTDTAIAAVAEKSGITATDVRRWIDASFAVKRTGD